MNKSDNMKLKEIALLFLRLGITSFGDPAAHIAIMQNGIVIKRN
jgi:chromate transporter